MIWIIFSIGGVLLAIIGINRKFEALNSELTWMNEAIVNEKVLEKKKNRAVSFNFVISQIGHGRICKGIDVGEFKSICGELPNFDSWENKKKGVTEFTLYGYGEGIPTPQLILRCIDSKLAGCKSIPNNVEIQYAFYRKNTNRKYE
ncbi:MAG: hypothetical protein WC543_00155 [Candidatus Omnitrophota bacterium]